MNPNKLLLPAIKPLEEFLKTITRFDPHSDHFTSIVVSPEKINRLPNGQEFKTKQQKLWFKEISNFTLDSTYRIIERVLEKLNHPTSECIINQILLLFTYLPHRSEGSIILLEDVFAKLQNVTLSQYYFLPMILEDDKNSISFGRYRIGRIDEVKFEYRCKKGTSNYYELYMERIRNRLVIERDYFETSIIVWQNMFDRYFVKPSSFDEHLLGYYENISIILFDEFWELFIEDQYLQVSMGVGYIEDKMFKNVFSHEIVSIYTNIKAFDRNVGYLVPEMRGVRGISFQHKLNESIQNLNNNLVNDYNFKGLSSSEIHETIKSYIKFNCKAYIHLHENKNNEGFLHFVISLDLLLGEKMTSTQSVCNRAAILTFKSFDFSFELQRKLLEKIYDARSKYVHKGIDINIELLDSLKNICRVILEILLKIQSTPKYQLNESFSKWVKELDYFVSGIEAGKYWTDEDLALTGIVRINILERDTF